MKFFNTECEYSHNWSKVTSAVWKKYPNEYSAHVLSTDIIGQEVDPKTGILKVERLITCKQNIPEFIRKLAGGDPVTYAYETSYIDPKEKVFTATSKNISFSNFMTVEETIEYKPHFDRTLFSQSAQITAFGTFGRNYLEDFSLNRFKDNAAIGRMAFEKVLEKLFGEPQLTTL